MKHHWKCNQCGYILQGDVPPNTCPSCKKDCVFMDVSCYTPECGGPESGNIDPRLAQDREPER